MQLGAGHTSGDIVAWVPDAQVMFSGDLIEYHSACYCGDAHLREWPATLNEIRAFDPKAVAPGRGDALTGQSMVRDAIAMTRDFVTTLYGAAESSVAKGRGLKDTMAAGYRAGGMTLVASGAVRHDEIVALAERAFAGLTPGRPAAPLPAVYGGGDARFTEALEQAHIAFAFPGLSNADPDYYVGQLYTAALGGGMSSRLFQEAREKRGLCYSIYAFTSGFQDGGFLSVYAGTGEAEAAEIAAVVAGEMEAMAGNLTEAELGRARAQLKASLLMGLERPAGRAEQIAGQLFALGRIQPPAEIIAQLDAIDVAMVKRYGAQVMQTATPAIAALGPISRLESHHRFARRYGVGALPHAAE